MRADKRDTATQNLSHTYSRLGMAGVVEGTQTAKRFVVHLSFDMWGVLLLRPCMLPILLQMPCMTDIPDAHYSSFYSSQEDLEVVER